MMTERRPPPPPPPAVEPPAMTEYACRACNGWLLSSDAPLGRVVVVCRGRRCGLRQTVYLGGRRSAAEVAQARAG
jgi:hypothetical protein